MSDVCSKEPIFLPQFGQFDEYLPMKTFLNCLSGMVRWMSFCLLNNKKPSSLWMQITTKRIA